MATAIRGLSQKRTEADFISSLHCPNAQDRQNLDELHVSFGQYHYKRQTCNGNVWLLLHSPLGNESESSSQYISVLAAFEAENYVLQTLFQWLSDHDQFLAVGNCQNYYETHSSESFESVKVRGQTLRAQDWKPELIWQL